MDCNGKAMSIINDLEEMSNRGKVAFAICCFESAIDFFVQDKKKWSFVDDELWKFCNSNMAYWHEQFGEITPFVVCEKIDFDLKEYKYLTREQHDMLLELYNGTNKVIISILELVYEVAITNIYVIIHNEKTKTDALPYLQSLIDIMNENNIPLPDIEMFKQFPVTENNGWGRDFTRDEVFKKNN
jgi:hypothetical protein